MILYHGTSKANAMKIIKEGIRPRSEGTGNWENHPSIKDHVYLTKGYAPYFASQASQESEDAWAVIEVDTDKIEELFLYPDEDYLEQTTKNLSEEFIEREGLKHLFYDYPLENVTLNERTQWFRDRIERFAHFWEASLESMGTCSVKGAIPPEAINRVAFYDSSSNPLITSYSVDPTITILNWRICKHKFISLTEWFFGGAGDIVADPLYGTWPIMDDSEEISEDARKMLNMVEEQHAEAKKLLRERGGVEVVDCRVASITA